MKFIFVLLFTLILSACSSIEKQNKVQTLVEQWLGKTIVYPENILFTIQGSDTFSLQAQHHYDYKIISYVDSTGCTSCKLQLPRWSKFLEEIDSVSKGKVAFYLILYPKDIQEVRYTLKYNNFKHPVCIDEENVFNKINHFPSETSFQTFLLDKNDKVVALGNPIHNFKIKDLFLEIIQGKQIEKSERRVTNTKIDIKKDYFALGFFNWQEEQKVLFTLKNIGNKPLVIEHVTTSCGCIMVNYSKEPVPSGKEIALEIIYKAEHPGYFDKTISIYCNAEVSPIILRISGDAKGSEYT